VEEPITAVDNSDGQVAEAPVTGFAEPTVTDPVVDVFNVGDYPTLDKFKGEDGGLDNSKLAKSYVELEKMKGSSVKIPEAEDKEGWDKFYSKLGVPDTADKYSFEEREYNGLKFDDAAYADFKDVAKELNLTPEQANKLAEFDFNRQTAAHGSLAEQRAEANEATLTALKSEFGAKYDQVDNAIDTALESFTNKEESVILKSEIQSNPAMFKLMANMTAQFTESSLEGIGDVSIQSQEDAKAEYFRMLDDKDNPLNKAGHPEYDAANAKHMKLFKKFNQIKQVDNLLTR